MLQTSRMRRPLAAATLSCAFLLAVPATAQVPGDPVKVEPNAAGKGSHLVIDLRSSEDPAAGGRSPQQAVLAAAQGFKFDPRARTERCSNDQAKAFNCPGNSKIGSGVADATASNGVITQAVTADVSIFLAPPAKSGDAGGAHVQFRERSTGAQGSIFGRVVKLGSSGTFGLEVRFDDLSTANAAAPQGFTVRLDRLQADVGAFRHEKVTVCCKTVKKNGKKKKKVKYKKKVRRDLIRNPLTCKGSWPYQVRLRYSPTDESVRDGSVACTK
jgi:hypothetical protein